MNGQHASNLFQGDLFTGQVNSSIVGGHGNSNQINIHDHGLGAVFDKLCQHVAANALFNSGEVSDQPKCHEGTRIAILKHLTSWAAALTYTYFITWLHGPAGSGKSTILRTIAKLLFEQNLLLASFFFFRSSPGRNSSEKFIPTIAYQLTLSIPATRPFIMKAIERDPLVFSASLWDQAQALIVAPILAAHSNSPFDASQYPRVIVIDGVDECDDPDKQREILHVLMRVVQHLPVPFAVLIASRPEHRIRDAFDLGDLNRNSTRLSLDDEYQADNDIKEYLTDRFRDIREDHPFRSYLPTPWPPDGVIRTLVYRASGQFIYAATVDKFISSPRHKPAERLDKVINTSGSAEPFEQLDLLYSAIFSVINPTDLYRTLRVLGLLFLLPNYNIHSSSPAFVEIFFGMQTGDVRRLLLDLQSLLTVGRDDEGIQFFHTSLSDYLFDRSRSGQFWIDAGNIYAEIAEKHLPHFTESWDLGLTSSIIKYVFSRAKPTAQLHKAIQNCNFAPSKPYADPLDGAMFRTAYLPSLLLAIRSSNFVDAERLYRLKLTKYLECIKPSMQIYFKNAALKQALVASVFLELEDMYSELFMRIFDLSMSALELDKDEQHGFLLSDGCIPPFTTVMKDVFEDSKRQYFINDSLYADTSLHLMKCMTKGSEFHVDHNIAEMSTVVVEPFITIPGIEAAIANAFSILLSRSLIRRDLLSYEKEHWLSDVYLNYDQITTALVEYQKRADSQRWWHRLRAFQWKRYKKGS